MSKHRTRTTKWDRLLSGVLCLALVLGLLPAAGLVRTAGAESWADPYGQQLVDWGIMVPSQDLRLGDVITRAEFVAMCNRAFGYSRLGNIPFTDVPSHEWYAEDIAIAYAAGYFKGTTSNLASPKASLTREQAAVLIARNLVLQETVGESLGFTDSHDLSEWSRGLIAATAEEGIIYGRPDGSFAPFLEVTRGEVAAMLVRAIGNPISGPGSYEMGHVYGNVVISSSNVTLRDTVILGNLYITGGVDLGNVLLENVTVLGRIVLSGGGVSDSARSSVVLRNVVSDELAVDSIVNQFVTISTYGITDIPNTYVRSGAYLEDSSTPGYGLHRIVQDGASRLQLAGSIQEVVNKTPNSTLQLVSGTAEKITIDEYAANSELLVAMNTRVDELDLDVTALVTGKGDIIDLNIWADGCEVEILPEHVNIRPGLTATVDGSEIGSVEASELSSEPRLMAGYPTVGNLRPIQADGLFSANKPGTVYWAVSEIADGSVSIEDLIDNPAFGGNIFAKNAGDIKADSKVVYARQITGLEPDGSYYISAVLVDERGNRSPLKVVSFSTPDDTVPAFEEVPHMTKVSCEIAQVTTMVNKSCTLYWVLLPAGTSAPTVQNFKSGSFGGNYGYGSQSVVKNVPVSITVNSTRLQEKTAFDLYLWLNDFDGAMSSEVVHVLNKDTHKDTDPTFTTPDETAPVVTSIMQTNYDLENAIEFSFSISEDSSALYWAVVAETDTSFIKADDDLGGTRAQMKVESGMGAIVSGNKAGDGTRETRVTQGSGKNNFNPNLDPAKYGHNFKMYYMAKDAAGNCSEVRVLVIHTKDSENPTVTLKFTDALYDSDADKKAERNPRPQADSDIKLVFSEQVKGEEDIEAETFVDLYNEVKVYKDLIEAGDDNSANQAMLTRAKDELAEALEKRITLYYVQVAGGRQTTTVLTRQVKDHGWIDFREATVELQKDRTVVLTLPGGKAVQLGGGMTYYFHFKDIFDDSYDANPLMVIGEDGEEHTSDENDCNLPRFTTVFAQVWLSADNTNITEIAGNTGNASLNGTPLDIVVNVAPESTGNTSGTVSWDMVIWSKKEAFVAAKFIVYRRIDNGSGGWGEWEQVTDETDIPGPGLPAISLNANKSDDYIKGKDFEGEKNEYQHSEYDAVSGGLQEGRVYQYGISFTSVGSNAGSTERESWTSLVTLQISLVAGDQGIVRILADSGNVDSTYTQRVHNSTETQGKLYEIGSVDLETSIATILEVEKQFKDERLPAITSIYPTFETTSNSITMQVALDHAGTIYYVAAPADGTITTSIKDGDVITEITAKNDGRGVDEWDNGEEHNYVNETARGEAIDDYFAGKTGVNAKTYIPVSGTDRTLYGQYIYFVPGAGERTGGRYYAPTYGQIFDGQNAYADDGDVRTGSIQYTTTRKTEDILRLKPNTWYYIYVVLQSDGGSLDNVVQIYRVKTKPASPPIITISPSGFTASIATYDGAALTGNTTRPRVDSEILWALVNWSNLPSFFKDEFTWTNDASDTYSLLEMLIGRESGSTNSRTLFDAHAGEAYLVNSSGAVTKTTAESYKTQIQDYIKNLGTYTEAERSLDRGTLDFLASNGAITLKDFNNEPDSVEVQCGIIAMARVSGAGDGLENYGFAAAQGMYLPDPIPPVFVPQTTPIEMGTSSVSYIAVSNLKVTLDDAAIPDNIWRNMDDLGTLLDYEFEGDMTVTFTKPVYQYITINGSSVRRAVWGTGAAADSLTEVNLAKAVTMSTGVSLSVKSGKREAQETYQIHFKGLKMNRTIAFLDGRITNSSPTGQVSNMRLTLVFDPTLTGTELEMSPLFAESRVGGFKATWAVIPGV